MGLRNCHDWSSFRGSVLFEFDSDTTLARKPDLVLLGEPAHVNALGCRHSKRWEDVEELLVAGINVMSTLKEQVQPIFISVGLFQFDPYFVDRAGKGEGGLVGVGYRRAGVHADTKGIDAETTGDSFLDVRFADFFSVDEERAGAALAKFTAAAVVGEVESDGRIASRHWFARCDDGAGFVKPVEVINELAVFHIE